MHLCYVDDSGDSLRGVTLTALIVEDVRWTELLDAWLHGRREIYRLYSVPKLQELHANRLFKGRGQFCETKLQNEKFGDAQRAAAARIMLSHLSKKSTFTVFTVGSSDRSSTTVYAKFIAFLEDWAAENETQLMVFYDGQQGTDESGELDPVERKEIWERAIRSAAPYRDVHRSLDLKTRRIIEDVMMQDSRYSQLIQATDLLAYGAYHLHLQNHPEIWGTKNQPAPAAIRAYMQASKHWPEDSDHGVYWLD